MGLLDRHIARHYLVNVLTLLVILSCFVVTVDVTVNLGRYISVAGRQEWAGDGGASGLRRALITVLLVVNLWWPRLLHLYNLLLGLVLVAAMGFTCAQMVRQGELTAVLSSGRSLFRMARPIIAVALLMMGIQAINQELVIPRIAPLLTRDHGEAGRRTLGSTTVPVTSDAQGRIWYAGRFDADRGVLERLYIWERDAAGLATRRISAERASWDGGAWLLENPSVAIRQEGKADPAPPARVETDLDPTALKMKRYARFSQHLSWRQLSEMLSRDVVLDGETRAFLERLRFGRLSTMLANLLTVVIAMPFFLTRAPRSMVAQSLKYAPLGIIALIGGVFGATMAVPGVPAQLSVFIPVMVLIPVAVAMLSRVRT